MIALWCLHGFLGNGGDWVFLEEALSREGGIRIHRPDLLAAPGEVRSFPYWARKFNARAAGAEGTPILLGYSMGGRLALHCLLQPGAPWRGAVLVSAHPGLDSEEERRERLARDETWARRFEEDPWEEILADWNSQPVFQGRNPLPARREADFSRQALARALRVWSLGNQGPLLERLHQLEVPLLWIAGREDPPYLRLGERAARGNRRIRFVSLPGAGHRLPWEAPLPFLRQVRDFLGEVPEDPHST